MKLWYSMFFGFLGIAILIAYLINNVYEISPFLKGATALISITILALLMFGAYFKLVRIELDKRNKIDNMNA